MNDFKKTSNACKAANVIGPYFSYSKSNTWSLKQSKYKIIVVPTIIVFNHGEEVKRYQANIMMQIEAKLEDVQDLVDETVMESF